jgi:hypothetical protein
MSTPRGPGRPFQPGNKFGKGRPPGRRNKMTLQDLLDSEGEDILLKAIERAKTGASVPLRLCLERLLARQQERPVRLHLPTKIMTAGDIDSALGAVLAAVSQGEISVGDAVRITSILEVHRKAIQANEIERRLSELDVQLRNLSEAHDEKAHEQIGDPRERT